MLVCSSNFSCVRSRRMPKDPKKKGIFTERGWLIALAVAVGLVLGMAGPTSAQFFNFGGYQQRPQPQRGGGWFGNDQRGGGWFGNDTFAPYQQQYAPPRHGRQAAPAVREDFSKAPPPEKRNTVPERHILVLGDSMADWLAYGLEDVYADQPEMGVIRKHKTASGLIKYQPKGNPADWAAAAKGILATEKADAIVVMLGLDDRVAIREPAADKSDTSRGTRRTPRPSPMASLRPKNPRRSRMAQPRWRIPNCRQTMLPTAMVRGRSQDRRRARARRTASMSFATNAGWNSTEKRSTR